VRHPGLAARLGDDDVRGILRAAAETRGAVGCSGPVIARMPSTPMTPSTIAARTDGKGASSSSPVVGETSDRTLAPPAATARPTAARSA
jgi:hypothetical protein